MQLRARNGIRSRVPGGVCIRSRPDCDALTFLGVFALIRGVDEQANTLEPLPYHLELRDYLKSEERELWNWFVSAKAKADYTENLRLELLKSTYRLDSDGHPELYQGLEAAK